jgi:hypothetical protein
MFAKISKNTTDKQGKPTLRCDTRDSCDRRGASVTFATGSSIPGYHGPLRKPIQIEPWPSKRPPEWVGHQGSGIRVDNGKQLNYNLSMRLIHWSQTLAGAGLFSVSMLGTSLRGLSFLGLTTSL